MRTPFSPLACRRLVLLMLLMTSTLVAHEPRLTGRTYATDDGPVLAYPGTLIEARITGTSRLELQATLMSGEEAWFNVWINGTEGPPLKVVEGSRTWLLTEALRPANVYDVRLVRRSEAWAGTVRFEGLTGDEGLTLAPLPPRPERRLMCLGDSITCGAGVHREPPFGTESHYYNDAERAYPWLLAKQFGAAVHQVAYGGKGLIRDWQGLTTEVTAAQMFARAHPDVPASRWEHAAWTPDAVIIMLGTNDFNQGIIPHEDWVEAMTSLVETIRAAHPEAKVLLANSPMFPLNGADRAKRDALQKANAAVAARFDGDSVRVWATTALPGTWYDSHPTAAQHVQIAAELGRVLHDWLGWTEAPQVLPMAR